MDAVVDPIAAVEAMGVAVVKTEQGTGDVAPD
jgi:hypothetical protein